MPKEERRILTEEEKKELLEKHKICYICDDPLESYTRAEIQFDHIYNYADGYPQDLSNFAPVHASPDKLFCFFGPGLCLPGSIGYSLSHGPAPSLINTLLSRGGRSKPLSVHYLLSQKCPIYPDDLHSLAF